MAPIFETGIGGPEGSSVGVRKPVVDESALTGLKALGDAAELFGERKKAQALGEFSRQADAIGQSFHQGDLNKSQARVKLGQIYSSFVSGNVDMREDFSDLYTKIAKNYGISEGKTFRSAEDEQNIATFERAVQFGFINDSMTESQRTAGFNAMRQMDAYRESMKASQEELAHINSNTDLSEKQRKLEEERVMRGLRSNLRNMSEASFVRTQNQIDGVFSRYNSNRTTEGRTQAVAELSAIRSAIRQEAFSVGGGRIPKEELELLLSAHEEALSLMEMGVKGEIGDKVLQDELTRIKNQSQAAALENPAIRKAHGMVAILGPNIISEKNAIELTSAYLADVEANEGEAPTPKTGSSQAAQRSREAGKIVRQSGKALARTIATLPKGDFRTGKVGEVQELVTAEGRMLANRAFDIEKPSLMRDTLEFFGSPEMTSLLRDGEVTLEDPKQVVTNIGSTYLRGVKRTIDSTLNNTVRVGGVERGVSELFEATSNGGVVRFTLKPGLTMVEGFVSQKGLPTRQSISPNAVNASEVRRVKADLDNLAKAYNVGVNAIYAIDKGLSSKQQAVDMLMGLDAGIAPEAVQPEQTPSAPEVKAPESTGVDVDKPLDQFTQEDFFSMTPDQRRYVLSRAGVNDPGGA